MLVATPDRFANLPVARGTMVAVGQTNTSSEGHRTIVWANPEQVGFVRAIGEVAGLKFVGAGTAVRGRSAEVALALAAAPIDDLRASMATAVFEGEGGVDLILIAAPHDFAADLSSAAEADREAVRTCRERGVLVVGLEAMPASVLAYARPTAGTPEIADDEGGVQDPHLAAFVPRLRASRRFRELADLLEGFGPARAVQIEAMCRREEGTLGAKLYDAIDAVRWLLGDPETVHAVYSAPPGVERVAARDLSTDTLRGVEGTMSVNLQFGDGRMAHIMASDCAARWSRSATLLGDGSTPEAGVLRVGDEVFQWIGADGGMLDAGRTPRKRGGRKATPTGTASSGGATAAPVQAEVIGSQIKELLSGLAAPEPPIESARVLATAGAILLSARTGQSESVATVLRMMGMGIG